MTRLGTSHFKNRTKALVYYAKYHQSGMSREVMETVREKIKRGEIHIGKPDFGTDPQLDEDGRYHVTV